MAKDDQRKTKSELIDELEELRRTLGESRIDSSDANEPIFAGEMSRRSALKTAWVAPVILSIPMATSVVGTRRAFAQTVPPPQMDPTMMPPTEPAPAPMEPTSAPTLPVTSASALSTGGAAAMAGILFGFGAKKLAGAKRETGAAEPEKSNATQNRHNSEDDTDE